MAEDEEPPYEYGDRYAHYHAVKPTISLELARSLRQSMIDDGLPDPDPEMPDPEPESDPVAHGSPGREPDDGRTTSSELSRPRGNPP